MMVRTIYHQTSAVSCILVKKKGFELLITSQIDASITANNLANLLS